MPYNLDNLSPERFQELCQALLANGAPDLRCFPVGQPDGGRDASIGGKVFQIKFGRAGDRISDPAKWMINAAKKELKKVEVLAAQGKATEYVLVTNALGSGHLKVGQKDRVQEYLDSNFPIPASVWWRNEIFAHLDGNFDVCLNYPEILTGTQALRLMIERMPQPDRDKRNRIIQAYLKDQFTTDETVRFKQADLDASPLFDLFVDVPIRLAGLQRAGSGSKSDNIIFAEFGVEIRKQSHQLQGAGRFTEYAEHSRNNTASSASTILSERFLKATKLLVVIEGAPGQGKTTLSQFISQVHRCRLLNNSDELASQWQQFEAAGIRVPIKIELRDLARWLNNVNPWSSGGNERHNMPATVEGAIAGHIAHYSGGANFDIDDLHSLVAASRTIVFLDALDEVADLEDRRKVIAAVTDTAARLGAVGDIKFIITSRPSATPNSPTFPKDRSTYLSLASLERQQALDYGERWTRLKRLRPRERAEIIEVLRGKLDQPHMAELAKNTMQLTILLSLVQARGVSLPDARTALYDSYIEVFLNREAEKSYLVRDNRRLLIDLHRYIAYYLHSNAEQKKLSGRIAVDDLLLLLKEYLAKQDRDTGIVDDLFAGIDRVFVLVSRVEGTLEFDVQPLREYFAARYLYDTAGYSIAGLRRRGTKPDRFDGVARNPYWANVARFFAGCFSKGELADLAERVSALLEETSTTDPVSTRVLAVSMLEDWVFEESVPATKRVIEALVKDIGCRLMTNPFFGLAHQIVRGRPMVIFAEPNASRIFTETLWNELRTSTFSERAVDFSVVVSGQPSRPSYQSWLEEAISRNSETFADWMKVGRHAYIFKGESVDDVLAHISTKTSLTPSVEFNLLAGGANLSRTLNEPEQEELLSHAELEIFAERNLLQSVYENPSFSLFQLLSNANSWRMLTENHQVGTNQLIHFLSLDVKRDETLSKLDRFVKELKEIFSGCERSEMATRLGPWREIVAAAERLCLQLWLPYELALVSGNISSAEERGVGAKDILDSSQPLSDRVRYAQRKRADLTYWRQSLLDAMTAEPYLQAFVLACFYSRADQVVINGLLDTSQDLSALLPKTVSAKLKYSLSSWGAAWRGALEINNLSDASSDSLCFLWARLTSDVRWDLGSAAFTRNDDPHTASLLLSVIPDALSKGRLSVADSVALSEQIMERGAISDYIWTDMKIPTEAIALYLRDGARLPNSLLLMAVRQLKQPRARRVATVAKAERWFDS